MWTNYRNGKLHWLRKKAKRGYDDKEFRKDQWCFDVFGQKPIGRIEQFVTDCDYIKAVIKGSKIDIDDLYFE